MLNDDDDPLSGSIFNYDSGNMSTSFFSNAGDSTANLTTSFFTPQYDDDPWSTVDKPSQQQPQPQPTISTLTMRSHSPPILQQHTLPFTTHSPPSNVLGSPVISSSNLFDQQQQQPSLASLLNGINLPDIYDTAFAQLQNSGRVSNPALHDLLEVNGGLSTIESDKITRMVLSESGGSYVNRTEFNVALALLACAQNRLGISLNTLQRYRYGLPVPMLDNMFPSPPLSRRSTDPLKSQHQEPSSPLAGSESSRINSTYSGMDKSEHSTPRVRSPELKDHKAPKAYDTQKWFQQVEEIKVTIAPEREGFIFKHVNYIVESQKRSSIVLRRFSDFWWLMEVLTRRYPFRALPNLPPKKVGGTSSQQRVVGDSAFLEKRRKGLLRFINAVVRHPALRNDEIVIKFLTEPSELAAWRKQNPPSLNEEYRRKEHDIEELKSMIPNNLDEQLKKTRQRVGSAIEHYVNLCFIMERMIRRMHGQATDYVRYGISLNALAETEHQYHANGCDPCQQIILGYENVAKHMQRESSILESQVNNDADGVIENLKNVRDLLVAYRELDERKDKLAASQIDSLQKRIQQNRAKVNQHKGVPGFEAEVANLEESIRTDERELNDQKCRQIFIQFCMWSELIYLHKQQAFVSSLYRDYVKDMSQYIQQRADNWKDLESQVLQMPVEPPLFS